jgi:hypothetical protein
MMKTSTSKNASQSNIIRYLLMFSALLLGSVFSFAQVTYTTTSTNNWSTQVWTPAGTPGINDHVIINHNIQANAVVSIKNLTVNASRTLTITGSNFTANGTTTVAGTLTDNNNSGTNEFVGLVTINSGASFNTANNSPYTFGGGISNAGTFSKTGTGAVVVNNSTSIGGSGAITMAGTVAVNGNTAINAGSTVNWSGFVTVAAGVSINNSGTVNCSGILNGANATTSIWNNLNGSTLNYSNAAAPMATGVLDASTATNTVNYNLNAAQNVKNGTYNNLTLSAGNTKTAAGIISVNNVFNVAAGVTFDPAAHNFTAASSSTIAGTFTDNNTAGLNLFTGLVTITGSLTNLNTISHNFEFRGGIALNATGTVNLQNAGTAKFSTNNQTFSILGGNGTMSFVNVEVNGDISLTNNVNSAGGLTIRGNLDGTSNGSTFVNNTTLNYQGANEPMATTGVLNLSYAGNTVNYAGSVQTIKETTYQNIGFTATGNKTIGNITVSGSFTRSNGTLIFSGIQTFSGATAATFNTNANLNFSEIIINKGGSTLTLNNSGSITTAKLTVSAGSLVFGSGSVRTVTLTDDLDGAGTINMSGAAHVLNLGGANNSIGTLVSDANASNINYNRTGNQEIFSSLQYRTLTISGTEIKTLGGPTRVQSNLNLAANGSYLNLGNSDLKIAVGATLSGTFSSSRYIITDGTGSIIKEGSTVTEFRSFNPSAMGFFPVGSGGFFTPYQITAITGSVVGTAYISVRAVSSRQPNVPYFNNALTKYWDIETTNLTVTSATTAFTFNASEVIGSVTGYVPRVWNGTTLSAISSPGTASSPGSNPFTITNNNFIAGQWTAIDPVVRAALYSYQSGDWGNANTWTTDPSGNTLVSPMVPDAGDQVVILNGRTVTTSVARTVGSVTINNGGVLDLGASTAHSFGPIAGEGRLRLSSVSLPSGNYNSFVASTGGTIEYYNLGASDLILSTVQTTYNNLEFRNSTATANTVSINANLTINGNLSAEKTSSGGITLIIGDDATSRTINLLKNVRIGAGCAWNVGSFNAFHTVNITGSLDNSGTVDFTNGADYAVPTTGAANVNFLGTTSNTIITFNSGSTSNFYGFTSNKQTNYELSLIASASSTVKFINNGYTVNALGNGILRFGANITLPRLIGSASGNYDIGGTTSLPVFWIDGANITYNGNGAIVPYGTLKITSGTLTCQAGQGGIVIRESGLILVEGGTINARMIRTSVTAVTHRGTYIQSDGTVTLTGDNSSEQGYYAVFSLPYNENVFKMSGGILNITRTNSIGSITPNGGFMIGSNPLNSEVTGGTINISTSGNFNFDITTRAPLWNLNILKASSGTGTVRINPITWSYNGSISTQVTVPAYPLVVLGDLNVNSSSLSATLNANGNDISCAQNFTIQSGATFTPGLNTITFNGTGNQTFSIATGTISGGINNLTINKTAGSLTMAGTSTAIQANGNLNITLGTLNDGGKTISVRGNVVNNSLHVGTGKIQLNSSTAAQTISGNGNGIFQNLEIANSNGAAGSSQVSLLDGIGVNGTLTISTDRVFFISIYPLNLGATGTITASPGTFGTNRFIRTQGYLSDGGIIKTYSASAPNFTFPFGTGANYTPATINFGSAPATWGSLNVRPVTAPQLYVTNSDVFQYYWKVNQTGFTGTTPSSINMVFNYGNLTDKPAYVPGYYNYQTISYTTVNNVSAVDETTNNINFSSWSNLQGDYTAGVPAAFGVVIPYYSRANGNWNTATTWSNVGFGGTPSSTIPNSNVPVFIGDGSAYNHTVAVTTNGTISGSLIIANGSTLDCGTTTGNNFGALPYATAGGNGKIRISSSASTAQFPAGDFGLFFLASGGTTEYYGGSTNFNIPLNTASPTSMQIRSYRNLQLSPSSSARIRMPEYDLDIYGDLTVSAISGTGEATTNDASSKTVTIQGSMLISAGTFRFANAASQTFNVSGDLTIGDGATMALTSGSARIHNLSLYGNLTNNGIVDFDEGSVDLIVNMLGNSAKSITGTNAAASMSLYNLNINKGFDKSIVVDFNMPGTINASHDNWLQIVNGTFRFSRTGTITLTSGANVTYTIPATSRLSVNHSSAQVNIGQNNSNGADLVLGGTLEILNGTVNIGSSAYNSHNDLEYTPTDIPVIDIRNTGVLNVNGQIRRSVFSLQGGLIYSQSGNSTVLVRGKNGESAGSFNLDRAKFEILNENSQFNMSDNALLIIDRSGLSSTMFGDIYLDPSSFNMTGGEVRIGTALSPSGSVFNLTASSPFWNLSIDGSTTSKTCNNLVNATTVLNDLRIEGNSIFNANGLDITIGGDLVNQNTSSATGLVSGGYRPATASQTTYFTGNTGNQEITGFTANLTNFANVVINNTWPAGTISCIGNQSAIRVNGNLTLTSGTLNLNDNNFTTTGHVNTAVNTVNGTGYFVMGGSSSQVISGSGTASFANFRMANNAGVELTAPLTINGNLNFAQGLLYINNHLLTLGEANTITGTMNSSNMIRVNGVISDAGVTKYFPASAYDFTFQIRTTLKHTPARYNITSNSVAGSINIKPVGVKHPATTDLLNKELTYYWSVSKTGFSPSITASHYLTYHPNDAINGNEANYVTGRYFNNQWTPGNGIPSTVDNLNDMITLSNVNYIDGDFTAGEANEFGVIQTYFSRTATLGGNWSDVNTWSTDAVLQHNGAPCSTAPASNNIVIASGHTITCQPTDNNKLAPISVINGTLNLNSTSGHNLGYISGTGKIRISQSAANQFILPGGDLNDFTSLNGGTIEFSSNVNATLPLNTVYNNLQFSGSAVKNLANTDIIVNGDLVISQGTVTNVNSRDILLSGNWENQVGISGWNQGSGKVNLSGTNQNITGSTGFSNLLISGGGIKTLYSTISVTNLNLINGIVSTGSNEVSIPATGDVIGESTNSYINGYLRKVIPAGALTVNFEIGDATQFAPASISFNGSPNAGGNVLARTSLGDHASVYISGINQNKSVNRTWQLTATSLTGFTNYSATFNFVSTDVDAAANPTNFIGSRFNGSSWSAAPGSNAYPLYTTLTGLTGFGSFQIGEGMNGIIWTGASNTNWNNASNWLPNEIPGMDDDIFIGPVTNQPNFTSGSNGNCRDMNLEAGVMINIPSAFKVEVRGNINSSGASIIGQGVLQIQNSSAEVNGNLAIESNLFIGNGAILTINPSSTVEFHRNLYVNGELNTNGQAIAFAGGENSMIRGTGIVLNDVIVNKQSENLELTLDNNITINGNLTLTMGDVNLNGKQLTLGSNSTLIGETFDNRVHGADGTITTTRNINAPNALNVAGLGIELTSSENFGSTTVVRGNSQKVFNAGYGINRYYEIHPTNNDDLDATMKFNYFEDELNTNLGTITEGELDLWRFDGAVWNFQWATVDLANNFITKTNIPQFSTWTSGSRDNNSLPITLTNFVADCAGDQLYITWTTASEINNKEFYIEASSDAITWKKIYTLPGAGNSNTNLNYEATVKSSFEKGGYVRLRQVDFNGQSQIFDPAFVSCQPPTSNEISLSPNPAIDYVDVQFKSEQKSDVTMTVFSSAGQILLNSTVEIAEGTSAVRLDILSLPVGVYHLNLSNNKKIEFSGSRSIIKR